MMQLSGCESYGSATNCTQNARPCELAGHVGGRHCVLCLQQPDNHEKDKHRSRTTERVCVDQAIRANAHLTYSRVLTCLKRKRKVTTNVSKQRDDRIPLVSNEDVIRKAPRVLDANRVFV